MNYKQRLTSIERRIRRKTALRIGGIVIAAIGLMFFPVRSFVFSRRSTSAFQAIADLGAFIPWGAACVTVGLLAIGASFLIRGDLSE
jgi:hypothetical protein